TRFDCDWSSDVCSSDLAQYLSPEQAQGHAVSASSDLYSIGVVLYEMLTGHVPFDAEAAVTIALKHVSEAPTAPTQLNPRIPPERSEERRVGKECRCGGW